MLNDPETLLARWLFDDDPAYWAVIMAECGCDIDDIAATLDLSKAAVSKIILGMPRGQVGVSVRKNARYWVVRGGGTA